MTKGFYQLTSGILSQGRRLDVIGNNMTNLSTAGYKAETYTDRTFQEVLISRVGNKDKSGATVIGEESYILAPDQLYVNYSQGTMKETGLTLDFAIQGDGFFAIQTDNGVEYTRSGSFCLNDQGQLTLAGQGTVLGTDGQPITLSTDQIRADDAGRIYTEDGAIVSVALSQVGNVGGEPYWSWYGFSSRVEWCACFVSWCANECGYIDTGVIPKYAGCVNGVQWFKDRGQWMDGSAEPAPGMIIFFDWNDENGQDGLSDHTGIVEKVENGRVYTIEGNSGDSVRQNSYPVGHYEVLGYGCPDF